MLIRLQMWFVVRNERNAEGNSWKEFTDSIVCRTMTASAHCSPSRSSLSCCQFDHNSHDDVHGVTNAAKDSYFIEDKCSFPKRPEVDLTFYDIQYRVKQWNLRQLKPSKLLTLFIPQNLTCQIKRLTRTEVLRTVWKWSQDID